MYVHTLFMPIRHWSKSLPSLKGIAEVDQHVQVRKYVILGPTFIFKDIYCTKYVYMCACNGYNSVYT